MARGGEGVSNRCAQGDDVRMLFSDAPWGAQVRKGDCNKSMWAGDRDRARAHQALGLLLPLLCTGLRT